MDPTPDAEFRLPLLPCQRPVVTADTIDDETGDLVEQVLVLPNITLQLAPRNGVLVGMHLVSTLSWSERMAEILPVIAEDANQCECPDHAGRSMIVTDGRE